MLPPTIRHPGSHPLYYELLFCIQESRMRLCSHDCNGVDGSCGALTVSSDVIDRAHHSTETGDLARPA